MFPRLGKRSVADISTADIMAVLMPIWNEKPETARRVRQRISTVMKWAVAQGYRADNPAGDAIGAALPQTQQQGQAPSSGLAAWRGRGLPLRRCVAPTPGSSVKLAFEFLVLTAARSGEVRFATWAEIDRESEDMARTGLTHEGRARTPRAALRPRTSTILGEARARDPTEAASSSLARASGKPLSDMTLSKLMRDLGLDAVPHGFRTSFRNWAGECTNAPREVMELSLAHTVRNKVEAAYNRTDLFERRRTLMEQWASYLDGAVDAVVPLVRRHG